MVENPEIRGRERFELSLPSGTRKAVLTAVGAGLAVGWLELAEVLAQRAFDPRISMDSLRTNRHFFWMIPAADLALFAAAGLVVALLSRVAPGLVRRQAWRGLAGLAALALLLAFEGLHLGAGVALAAGIGWRLGPLLQRVVERYRRLVLVALTVAATGLAALTVIGSARVASAEARALSGLPEAPEGAPNLLWIILDNVRADSMSLYGRDRPTTPNLDRLALEGVRFTQARSPAPWTLPSHASMFTGEWCHRLSFGYDRALDDARPTVAEGLSELGYSTAGFVGNTYYGNRRYGLGRGFARYEDCYENEAVSPFEVVRSSGLGRRVLQALGYSIHVAKGGTSARKSAAMINRDVLGWIDGRPRDRPFFAFLNYYDAHGPFIPPDGPGPRFGMAALPEREQAEILSRYQRHLSGKSKPNDGPADRIEREATAVFIDGYESCIASLDRRIGQLLEELKRRGLRENTLIVVTSDHGEHFQERGFSGHGLSVYRREVHVPLLIFPPTRFRAPARREVSEPVSLRDLAATSVHLLGLADRATFPGRSLARFWTEEGYRPRKSPVISEVAHQSHLQPVPWIPATLGQVRSVVADGKVYIRTGDGREELYDLRADPDERSNLAGAAAVQPPVGHFRDLLDQLLADADPPVDATASAPGHVDKTEYPD